MTLLIVALLVSCHHSNCVHVRVGSRTWVVCLLDVSDLKVFGERDSRRLDLIFWVVIAWSWVEVRVWYGEISSDICSNPVSDIGLVHGGLVDFVLARTWHVEVLRSCGSLHSEAELGVLAEPVIGPGWISEVEVALDFVIAWSWNSQVLSMLLACFSVLLYALVFNHGTLAISSGVAERSHPLWAVRVFLSLARVLLARKTFTWFRW